MKCNKRYIIYVIIFFLIGMFIGSKYGEEKAYNDCNIECAKLIFYENKEVFELAKDVSKMYPSVIIGKYDNQNRYDRILPTANIATFSKLFGLKNKRIEITQVNNYKDIIYFDMYNKGKIRMSIVNKGKKENEFENIKTLHDEHLIDNWYLQIQEDNRPWM